MRCTLNGLDRPVNDARIGFSSLEGKGGDDLEHGHVVVVVEVKPVLEAVAKAGLCERCVVPMIATLHHLVEGQHWREPRHGLFAVVQSTAVKGEGKPWTDHSTEEDGDVRQHEEERIAVGECVLHFVHEALNERLLSVKERFVVLVWGPMGEAHARKDNGAQTHERQDEQRGLDPRVGWMHVRCNLGLWRSCEGLEPHTGHVEAGHGSAEQHAHGGVEEAGVVKGDSPSVGDDAFL